MNKLTFAVLALLLAAMGGCAGNGGDLMGTGVLDNNAGPIPPQVEVQAQG